MWPKRTGSQEKKSPVLELSKEKVSVHQVLRFGVVGLVNFVGSYALFYLLLAAAIHYLLAQILVTIAWSFPGLILQRIFVFGTSDSPFPLARYIVSQLCFLFFGLVLMNGLVGGARLDPLVAFCIVVLIVAPLMFLSNRLFVFGSLLMPLRNHSRPAAEEGKFE